MPTTERLKEAPSTIPESKTNYFLDAKARIKVRNAKPIDFTPVKIEGESISETIVRERRGEF